MLKFMGKHREEHHGGGIKNKKELGTKIKRYEEVGMSSQKIDVTSEDGEEFSVQPRRLLSICGLRPISTFTREFLQNASQLKKLSSQYGRLIERSRKGCLITP